MQDVIELTRRLVAFDSVSCNSNLEIAYFLSEILKSMGFSVQLYEKDYSGVVKTNLVARIGPENVAPLMLCGHMDTMPVGNLKDWATNPFELAEKGEKLYGRGSVDMKGPLAAMVCSVESLVGQASKFNRELIFGLTHDEEIGLKGARRMVKDKIVSPKFTLIAEPTELVPMRMHKGHLCLRATCKGETAHAGDPSKGINAIELAAEVIAELKKFREELKGVAEPCIEPPYTTLNIATIDSVDKKTGFKAKLNEVPWVCEIEFAIRPIPGQSTDRIKRYIEDRLTKIRWNRKTGVSLVNIDLVDKEKGRLPTDPMCIPADSEIVKVVEQVSGEIARGANYSTDASVLQYLNTDCLIFGPGSIRQAHKPNEFIEKSQLLKSVDQFREIVKIMCLGGVR